MSARVRSWARPARAALRGALVVLAAVVVLTTGVLAAALVTGEFPGDETWPIRVALAGAVVGAALWTPLRRAALGLAARLVHGVARSPEDVVRSLAGRSARDVSDDELLVQLAEALVRGLRASAAEVWREDAGVLSRVASVPHRSPATIELDPAARRVLAGGGVVGRAWAEMWQPDLVADRGPGEVRFAPATHDGRLLGLIVVSRLASADRFTPAEDGSLADLGGRLGVLLHNRALDATLQDTLADLRATNAELRASRIRLVATADAERRRIERNLHDGAQQHLVALAVNLKLAAAEIATDPSVAPGLFASLGDDVRDAIEELRSLAHGIYPPLLMDAGLVEAMRVSARRSPSPVTVTHQGIGRYPLETEAAAYFCCMEALQNAAKHAPGAAVRVDLREDDGELRFSVEDDGPGIQGDVVQLGHGLGNMNDRMVAVGGRLDVGRSSTGGARIAGAIPVARREVAVDEGPRR